MLCVIEEILFLQSLIIILNAKWFKSRFFTYGRTRGYNILIDFFKNWNIKGTQYSIWKFSNLYSYVLVYKLS